MSTKLNYTKNIKFKAGNHTRISKYKNIFEKGNMSNWTTKIFTINLMMNINPVTDKLIGCQKNPIEGGFYRKELPKVRNPDIYLVEKVLKKKWK